MGKALAGGSGWVLLCWSPALGRMVNQWAADHTHCLAGGDILLALDMYKHAYHLDFGANAGAYVDAFMRNVHWDYVAWLRGEPAAQPARRANPPSCGRCRGTKGHAGAWRRRYH
jgi:Fe-Mn family superoxide dismutase